MPASLPKKNRGFIERAQRAMKKRKLQKLRHSPARRKLLAEINPYSSGANWFAKQIEKDSAEIRLIRSGKDAWFNALSPPEQKQVLAELKDDAFVNAIIRGNFLAERNRIKAALEKQRKKRKIKL